MIHPATYLNKIVVATTNSLFIINVRSAKLLYKSPEQQFEGEDISAIESAPVLDVVAVGTSSGNVFLYNLKKGKILGEKLLPQVQNHLQELLLFHLEQMELLI